MKNKSSRMKQVAIFSILGLILLTTNVYSQTEDEEVNLCTQTLKDAQESYDDGRLNPIPSMLENCLNTGGFSRAEKLSALKLLVLTYLFQDEDQKAEETLLNLLREDPDYKVNEALDPAEFIYLYNSYRTLPVVSIGLMGGVNQSRVKVTEEFSTDNVNSSEPNYSPAYGYQFGVVADILLYKNLQINTALLFSGKKFKMNNDKMFGYTTLSLTESQSRFELPISFKYNFGKKKFVPFVLAGFSTNLFLTSKGNLQRQNDKDIDASGPSVDMSNLRNKFTFSGVFGGGARYKLGYGYMVLDIRYNLGLSNVVNVNKRYSNSELVYYYGYIDSNYKLNNITVSVGYLKSIYKPKKNKVSNE